jgi:chemotaxis-related protein WspD
MIDDCWNKIGVRGDASCPDLQLYAHCRNCPVFAAAATEVLRTTARDDSLGDQTRHFAEVKQLEGGETESVVIFRVGAEWLALPTAVVNEVANIKPVHTLPHRTGGVVLGVTNVRGELLISVSLALILALQPSTDSNGAATPTLYARLLVLCRDALRVVCPVDEVHGVYRFRPGTLKDIPATLAKAGAGYSRKLLPWNGHSVAVLDDQLLFYALKGRVA